MKISVRQNGDLSDVWVLLTENEAESVAHALRARLDGESGYGGPGYHLHIETTDENGQDWELTIGVLDPE